MTASRRKSAVQASAQPQARQAEEVQRLAEAWFTRQVERLEKLHGSAWPKNREWVEDYLRGQLRQRLLELGWRPRR
jgi:hypothetical protein